MLCNLSFANWQTKTGFTHSQREEWIDISHDLVLYNVNNASTPHLTIVAQAIHNQSLLRNDPWEKMVNKLYGMIKKVRL